MRETIAVIAGTPVDTQMGVDFLESKGIEAVGYPISDNPKEQSRLQLLEKELLYNIVVDIVKKAKSVGIHKIFVYCNSLSAAVDMDRVSQDTGTYIVTPFNVYKDLSKKYSSLFILAANGQSCAKIETIFEESNEYIRLWSLSALTLVEEIETNDPPTEIYDRLAIGDILNWAKLNKIEAIILGCTHFPYILNILEQNTTIPIIDPAEKMVDRLKTDGDS